MKLRIAWAGAIGLMISAGAARAQVAPATPPANQPAHPAPLTDDEMAANSELAERFCETGLKLARSTKYSALGLRQSAVLLEAAARLSPSEPRILRMLAFWRTQTGDIAGAISAWKRYRSIVPMADDRVAQSALIDLYLAQLQSNDAKIKYIREDLLNKPTLDDTVKAHIAAEAVSLLDQRSHGEAMAMLAQARKFYPLPEVTLLEWQMLPADATPVQRLAAMLNVLRTDPSNDAAIGAVADLLSANGISDKALVWYELFLDIQDINNTRPGEATVLNHLAELYRNGQSEKANNRLEAILQRYSDDPHAWFLRLTIQRNQESAQVLEQARDMFAHRLDDLCDRIKKAPVANELAGPQVAPTTARAQTQPATQATTQATTQPDPKITEATTRVKQLDPKVESVLVDTLAEQAWFELYYDHNAAAALPAINALKELVSADSAAMRRLQGWYDLITHDEVGARALLTPQKDEDALSALGLYELETQKKHTTDAAALAGKLLAFPQTGELAAVIFQATRANGIKTTAASSEAAAMKAEFEKFPADWLEINRNPQRFYSLRADPITPGHQLGDPMLAEITLTNNSALDITIGEHGLIKPAFSFDAQLRGVELEPFPGVLVDRIMGRLVLHPRESISQIVRVDQGDLNAALYKRPAVPLFVNAVVVTNTPPENPGGRPQAGGYAKPFERVFARNPVGLGLVAARQNIFGQLASNGPGKQKILDLDLIGVYYKQYVQPNATNAELAAAGDFLNAIDATRSDPNASVRAWANYTYAEVSSGVQQSEVIVGMVQAPGYESQLLGLAAAQKSLSRDMARQLATKAASGDVDPLVKSYATGLIATLNQQLTTQPASIQPEPTDTK